MFVICFSERGVNVWIAGRGGRVGHRPGGEHRHESDERERRAAALAPLVLDLSLPSSRHSCRGGV